VLVIDDDPTARDLMQRFLKPDGLHVLCAPSGEEGLRLARELHPAAITLDVLMPGMDGWAVLAALKADSAVADIPVIMVTILDDRRLGYTLGAAEVLTKPVDRRRLLSLLARYVRDTRARMVLVVDDDERTRGLLCRTLEADGWTVDEAADGRLALGRLAARQPDVIVLDLLMPEMDGFGVIAELQAHQDWKHIPVVVVTAKELTADDRQRLNGHVQRVLQKGSYGREQLLAQVRELVATSVGRTKASMV
jgi:CheY-like chemotaxis protein